MEKKKSILSYGFFYGVTRASFTDRNEEATCAVGAGEEGSGEELEPGVVTVEGEGVVGGGAFGLAGFPATPAASYKTCGAQLSEPCVLRGERGAGVALGEVEDEVEEGWDGACGKRFDAWHGDGGRSRVGGEGYSCTGADEAASY